jgi:hypothetical protein
MTEAIESDLKIENYIPREPVLLQLGQFYKCLNDTNLWRGLVVLA